MKSEKFLYLTDSEYIQALKNLKAEIESGVEFEAMDCETIGNKQTTCSWGLCTISANVWNNPTMHLWPEEFINNKRVAPKYTDDFRQICPFDRRSLDSSNQCRSGCFYTCAAFRKKKVSKEEVLTKLDNLIEIAEKWDN